MFEILSESLHFTLKSAIVNLLCLRENKNEQDLLNTQIYYLINSVYTNERIRLRG